MERELDRIQSEAYRTAQDIIGQGDAEAARIYSESYGADPEFYSFVQTLDTYKQTMQGNASLLLTTDSDFYRYLKGDGQPGESSTAPAPRTPTSDVSRSVN
jgi:membrane protease subunit HflC